MHLTFDPQVREIVQMFTNREELVEDYESAADHTTCRLAETERMEVDKSNTDPREGGLFGGCFNKIAPPGDPIYDIDDGVERCPACAWELEDGECVHCGGFGENDEFDMDGIGDFDEADEFSDSVSRDTEMRRRVFRQMANALRPPVPGARNNDPLRRQFDRILNNPHRDTDDSSSNDSSSDGSSSDGSSSDDSSSDDSSSEDESDGGEMASFIIDDEGLEEDHGPDHSTMMEEHSFMPDEMDQTLEMNPSMPHNPESPIEVEDSAEEVETSLRRPEWRSRALQIPPSSPDFLSRSSGLYGSSGSSGLEDDNDASSNEDEGSVAPSGAGSAGTSTTNPIAIDDDGDGDDGDDDDDDDDEDEGPIRPSRANRIRERRERRQANRRIRRSGERRRL